MNSIDQNFVSTYLVPSDAKNVISVQRQMNLSSSIARIETVKCVALVTLYSLYNSLAYVALGLFRCVTHLSKGACKKAFSELGINMLSSVKSITMVVTGVILLPISIFIPGKVSSSLSSSFPLQHISFPLQDIDIYRNLTDEDVIALVKEAPKLKSFHLSGCSRFTGKGIKALTEELRELESLSLSDYRATDEDIKKLVKGCPKLKSLHLNGHLNVTDGGIIALVEGLHELESLSLGTLQITGKKNIKAYAKSSKFNPKQIIYNLIDYIMFCSLQIEKRARKIIENQGILPLT